MAIFPKKRILIVGPYPPPYGGIASHLVSIVGNLIRSGFEPIFLVFSDQDTIETPEVGVMVYRVNTRTELKRILRSFFRGQGINIFRYLLFFMTHGFNAKRALRELARFCAIKRIVEEHEIPIVSSYMLQCSFFVPLLRKTLSRPIAICTTVLGELYEEPVEFKSRIKISNLALSESDEVMSSSRFCGKGVSVIGFDVERVQVVYYGVDLKRFDPESEELKQKAAEMKHSLGISSSSRLVLFVGRFNEEMGLDILLDCLRDFLVKHRDLVFLIAGAKGELSPRVMELARSLPGRIIVKENAPANEIPVYYHISEFLVAPSKANHPCMGVSIKEAMAAGRATIATTAGGIPEAIIEGETGLLIPALSNLKADPDELVRKMSVLLDSSDLAKQLGFEARKRAIEIFDRDTTAARVTKIFEKSLMARGISF